MPWHVYVIRSVKSGSHYVGMTTNLFERLHRHNSDRNPSTRNKGPWVLIHSELAKDGVSARLREKFLKSGVGRNWIKTLVMP